MSEVRALPTLKLSGKISIITGGASRIGEATARLFATNGVFVVIADIQDELGKKVVNSIGTRHCTYFHCNAADEQQVIDVINFTVKSYSHLDIMLSNVGIASPSAQTVLDLDLTQFDKLYAIIARDMLETCGTCNGGATCERKHHLYDERCFIKRSGNVYRLGIIRSTSKQLRVHGIRVDRAMSPLLVATPMSMSGSSEDNLKKALMFIGGYQA